MSFLASVEAYFDDKGHFEIIRCVLLFSGCIPSHAFFHLIHVWE